MTYKFTYKCRLCGEIFISGVTGSPETATNELSLITVFEEKATITEKTLHACNETDCGIADLLGYIGCERGEEEIVRRTEKLKRDERTYQA